MTRRIALTLLAAAVVPSLLGNLESSAHARTSLASTRQKLAGLDLTLKGPVGCTFQADRNGAYTCRFSMAGAIRIERWSVRMSPRDFRAMELKFRGEMKNRLVSEAWPTIAGHPAWQGTFSDANGTLRDATYFISTPTADFRLSYLDIPGRFDATAARQVAGSIQLIPRWTRHDWKLQGFGISVPNTWRYSTPRANRVQYHDAATGTSLAIDRYRNTDVLALAATIQANPGAGWRFVGGKTWTVGGATVRIVNLRSSDGRTTQSHFLVRVSKTQGYDVAFVAPADRHDHTTTNNVVRSFRAL